MEDGKLDDTEELRRAMHDMIVDSYNEATGLIVIRSPTRPAVRNCHLPSCKRGTTNAMR
jgi:hypothetical protein